ncbi:thiamine pyrophosphate-binding protein [Brachyspira aalborgi]|uniref:Thiamine pyrophosphate-binding protein n=1 Tax=Brachyspira aalborgi TaxID=29522 RepID=A0A5C8FUF9_9SPIR|nr:thiamine pyrophosphate-binding protein [Brachyspira aalborgi]
MKVSDYIAKRLKEVYEIKNIFLISGGGAMHLNDSFGKYIKYTTAHNEQALSMMAEGYARVNQKLAVVNVTTGPGGLNCLNGVFGQWTDSVPVLYISGQVKFETTVYSCRELNLRQLGDQETDIISAVKPFTKYSVIITNPYDIKYHLDKAVYLAMHGRFGPVWLDIPMNVQSAMIEEEKLKDFNENVDDCENIDTEQINKVIDKLNNSKKPIIIAGYGIRLSKQEDNFYKLIYKLNIPILSTFCGADIMPSNHNLCAGRIGNLGQRAGNIILQESDLILSLGTRNSIFQVSYNYENFGKNAYKIGVDIDNSELNKKTVKFDISINADLKYFIPQLLEKCEKLNTEKWVEKCKIYNDKFSFKNTKEYNTKNKKINPYYFVNKLTKLMNKNYIMITGNGSACNIAYQAGEVKKGQRIFWNKGCASMGYGLPASIGACIYNGIYNNKKNKVICLDGDGSIMMNIQELQTIKHYNLPIKVFILNNDGYISIKQTQNNFFEGHMVGSSRNSGVSMPDFNKVAKAFGIESVKISRYTDDKDLEKQINAVLESEKAIICNVILEDDYIFIPKLLAKKLDDGTMVSPSFENMYPFI